MWLKKTWAGLRECLPVPRTRSSPHHQDVGMRPALSTRTKSEKRHQDYLDKLPVPSLEKIEEIARTQEEKEREIEGKYKRDAEQSGPSEEEQRRDKAASTIQRNYRGYKLRRELSGLSLNPSSRWAEAIKEAQYRSLNTPHKRQALDHHDDSENGSKAIQNWKRISKITRHAHGDLPSLKKNSEDRRGSIKGMFGHTRHEKDWQGKMMDLPYFLEMVDLKHRYGSNLRSYHAEWKKTDTHENFFYWLDKGEGKDVEVPSCGRDRLEREQVRYLSREERMQYLAVVDEQGRLCWHKNGQRIDTTEEYRDSVEGIVPIADSAKKYREDEIKALEEAKKEREKQKGGDRPPTGKSDSTDTISNSSEGSASSSSSISDEDSKRYPDPPNLQKTHGPSKLKTVSPHLILNRLLRTTIKKNTWIFVADTSMNLYVGIKQSGAFQHSSFINGSRISAAGLIKIKGGQLRSLSPLSGHYRPPAAAFRNFVHHLKDEGVDVSRVSISKAYAVLVGLETYMSSKKRIRGAGHKVKVSVERVVLPEKARERQEREKDPSRSAKLEEEKLRELESQKGTGLDRVLREVREKVSFDLGGEQGKGKGNGTGTETEGVQEKGSELSHAPQASGNEEEGSRDAAATEELAEAEEKVALPDQTVGAENG